MSLARFKFNLQINLQYMRASESLLGEAIALSEGTLRDYFVRHLEEEQGHVGWLLEDLDGEELPPHPLPAAMAGTLYYLINHVHPVSLLGYMLALETPTPMSQVEEWEKLYGEKLCRTVRYHAVHDQAHCQDLHMLIHEQPPELKAHVARAYEWTTDFLRQLDVILQGIA